MLDPSCEIHVDALADGGLGLGVELRPALVGLGLLEQDVEIEQRAPRLLPRVGVAAARRGERRAPPRRARTRT